MGKVSLKHNIHVVVYPRRPGDFGFASIGGVTRSDIDTFRMCESIVSDIKRHVDDVDFAEVSWDTAHECEHCGATWSEDHDRHNGGCCAKDCDVMDAEAIE